MRLLRKTIGEGGGGSFKKEVVIGDVGGKEDIGLVFWEKQKTSEELAFEEALAKFKEQGWKKF